MRQYPDKGRNDRNKVRTLKRNSVKEDTKDCIATALVNLSKKKALSSISITELCQAAGVSRMAFYRNYSSKEEVFSSKLESLVDDYREVTASARAKGSPWFGADHLSVCFLFLRDNRDFVSSLYECGYTQLLVNAIAGFMIETWGNGTSEGDYVLTAFAGSICSCYSMWSSRDFEESPKQLADIVGRFYTTMPIANR